MNDGRLESWKEIAAYLERGVRTVQRWEKEEGLPVHRLAHERQGRVYAFRNQIDAWWESRRITLRQERDEVWRRRPSFVAVGLSFAAVLSFAFIAWRSEPVGPSKLLTPTPVETARGWKFFPSFSPSGQEVAFTLSSPGRNVDIYVKQIGKQGLRQLTDSIALDLGAAWSPDGAWIAVLSGFRTEGPKRDVMIVPETGGPAVKLAETSPDWGPFFAWTPDSRGLIYSSCQPPDPCALGLIDLETGAETRLTAPRDGPGGDTAPAVSSDGRQLLFVRRKGGHTARLHLQQLDSAFRPVGDPRPLTPDNVFATAPAWAPNDRYIFYITGDVGFAMQLWRQALDAEAAPQLLSSLGYDFFEPGISVLADRLVTVEPRIDINVHKLSLQEGVAASPSAILSSSNRIDEFPDVSPDGGRIIFHSRRDGGSDLYATDSAGNDLERLTYFGERRAREPQWSPEGTRIVFTVGEATGDLYAINVAEKEPRLLLGGVADDYLPSWSASGDEVFFTSNRTGSPEVWRVTPGGEPVRVTSNGGYRPIVDPDGGFVYYTKRLGGSQHGSPLYRTPLDGGAEEMVIEEPVFHPENFDVVSGRIYYATARRVDGLKKSIRCVEVRSRENRHVAAIGEAPGKGLSVSTEGDVVVFAQIDSYYSDLVLFEGI